MSGSVTCSKFLIDIDVDCCELGYSYNCDGVCSNSSTTSDGTLCFKCLSSELDEEDSVIDDGIGDPVGTL